MKHKYISRDLLVYSGTNIDIQASATSIYNEIINECADIYLVENLCSELNIYVEILIDKLSHKPIVKFL